MDIDYTKYLNIVPDCVIGFFKFALGDKVPLASIDLNMSFGLLPQDLSLEEYNRCKNEDYVDWGDGQSRKIFGADLSKYEGIIIWHSKYIDDALTFAMICSNYKGKLLHYYSPLNTSKGNMFAVPEIKKHVNDIKPVPTLLRESMASKYRALPASIPCIKNYFGGKFNIISREKLKQKILTHISSTPRCWAYATNSAMGKSAMGECYSPVLWDCLTLELACEGRIIISEMEFEPGKAIRHKLGCCLTKPYLLNGFDLRKLHSFKCFKPKIKSEFITKSPRLTQLQVDILNIMYDLDAISLNSTFVSTEKVVMIYYSNYSGTSNGEPINIIVDTIYAMAQPWRIKTPLLVAHGNIGTPEQCDFNYSGAADMFYTEIALSSYGKEVINSYLNKQQR